MPVAGEWNGSRFASSSSGGFYESYFQRANHPERPLAFWIRYTAFRPRSRPERAVGELWAIVFDGEAQQITAVKQVTPISECHFSPSHLEVRIGEARLRDGALRGEASSAAHRIRWDLAYTGGSAPLLLLPEAAYARGFPGAKALVSVPNALYRGLLDADGREITVDGWQGSQNHNWGSRHTDRHAWGQVAGFDGAPGSFLECSTAQVKLGPLWTPRLTLVVLRDRGREFRWNGFAQALRARGRCEPFAWTLETGSPEARIRGNISAPASAFVGLRYPNPPGGAKICLNTKLASADFTLEQPGQPSRRLSTRHRAAFEILGDREDPRVPVLA